MRSWSTFSIAAAALSLVAFGFAGSAAAAGKPEKPGKPDNGKKDTQTTFVVGKIVCADSRILDVSGDYSLAGSPGSLELSIVQDARGKLATSATLVQAGGASVQMALTGQLRFTGKTSLRLQLNGSLANTSQTSVRVEGPYDGSAFQLAVKISDVSGTKSYSAALTPAKTERGFTIEDAPMTPQGKKNLRGARTVVLPWGTQTLAAKHQTKGSEIAFSMHSSTFGIDLRGRAADTALSVTRNNVKVGYGNVVVPASATAVTPSAYAPK